MFNHSSSTNSNSLNQRPSPSSYSGIPQQQQSNNFGQQSSMVLSFDPNQQQQWMMRATMASGQNNNNFGQQIPNFLTNSENIFGKMPPNSNILKRQMENQQEDEKENLKIKRNRPCLDLDPPIPDGPEENKNNNLIDEDEADDEEEEEENSRSTKTDSSYCSENTPAEEKTENVDGNMPQFGGITIQPKGIYSITPQQQNPPIGHNNQFGMNISAPLAHSTPVLRDNFYANANAIQNLQQIYAGNFSHFGGPHYAAQLNPSIGAGPCTPSLGILANNRQNGQQSIQPYQQVHQQLFRGVYGGYSPSDNVLAAYAQQQQKQIHQQQLISPPSFNSIASYKIGNGSGVGAENRGGQKNESSGTAEGSSEESSTGAPNLVSIKEEANEEPKFKFPPYVRLIRQNDRMHWADLEEIIFDKPVPSRLSLLNINQKYQVSLAEIHRRLHPPECLNTSYLSGVLRRAKKADGGKILRKELAEYECGLELQSGKRKMSQVTAFTTLCEREALQMAKDFEKITNDPQNGFPHQQIAMEMNRREAVIKTTPEQKKQRMEELRSTMQILGEAICIVQNSIGMETQQFATPAELMAQPMQNNQLMPQTLDQFKRFARLSHCFGNRSIIVCWQSLLKVFGHYERLQSEFLPLDFSAASTSNNSASFLAKQEGEQ